VVAGADVCAPLDFTPNVFWPMIREFIRGLGRRKGTLQGSYESGAAGGYFSIAAGGGHQGAFFVVVRAMEGSFSWWAGEPQGKLGRVRYAGELRPGTNWSEDGLGAGWAGIFGRSRVGRDQRSFGLRTNQRPSWDASGKLFAMLITVERGGVKASTSLKKKKTPLARWDCLSCRRWGAQQCCALRGRRLNRYAVIMRRIGRAYLTVGCCV